jgi:hypothetical protein
MPFIAPLIEVGIAAAAAVSSFVAATGAIGSAIIGIGLSVATSYLIQALTPKPDTSTTASGSELSLQYGTNVSRKVAIGLCGTAGHDVYVNTFLPSNRTMQRVYVLSDFYTSGLNRVAIGGVYVTLGPDGGDGWGFPVATPAFSGYVWIKYYDGHQTTADPLLQAFSNPAGRWASNNIGLGVSYVIVRVDFDKDNMNSFPDLFFEFAGAPLYDWRKDSSAGGSGSQRWNDVSTWAFTENPVVAEYCYRRGFAVNGDVFCGMDMQPSDLPLDKYTAAAVLCDESSSVDGLPKYRVSAFLDCMANHGDNIKTLQLACGAMAVDALEGSWPIVGSAQPSVMTFYDTDLVSTAGNFKRTELRSMSELVNSVSGNFTDPTLVWSANGYKEQTDPVYLTLDRRTRDVAIDFPQVRSMRQANDLASLYLRENRYQATATVTLRPRFQVLEVGDWVDWVSARYNNTKTFLVTAKQLVSLEKGGPRNVILGLQERHGAIYDSAAPIIPSFPLPNGAPVYISEVDTLTVIAVALTGDDGRALPGIRASWNAINDVTVTAVEVQYFPTAQPDGILLKTVPAAVTVALLDGVVGNTQYTVRTRIITNPSRTTVYDAGVTVTTLDIKTGYADLNADIQYNITTLMGQFQNDLDGFRNLVSSLVGNQDGRNWLDKKEIRSQLNSVAGNAKASIATLQQAFTDAQTAFANYQVTVSAEFDTTNASVTTNSTAIAQLDGYAAAQYSITLDVNGYATGFNLFNGGAGISTATFIVDNFRVARPASGAAGTPKNIFAIGTVGGVSTIGISASMFIDGTITATMLNVISLSAINANLGTVTAGKIQSPSGNFVIDATNERIEIWS